jgi:hypothetical protein
MLRVERHSACIASLKGSTMLLSRLAHGVIRLAQRLQVLAIEEQNLIALMWCDVIDHAASPHDAALLAHSAEWLAQQVLLPQLLPSRSVVEMVPIRSSH